MSSSDVPSVRKDHMGRMRTTHPVSEEHRSGRPVVQRQAHPGRKGCGSSCQARLLLPPLRPLTRRQTKHPSTTERRLPCSSSAYSMPISPTPATSPSARPPTSGASTSSHTFSTTPEKSQLSQKLSAPADHKDISSASTTDGFPGELQQIQPSIFNARSFRYRVVRPIPSSSAARALFPPASASADSIALRSDRS